MDSEKPEVHKIKAILQDDLVQILEQLNLKDGIINGTVVCCNCEKRITLDNISSIQIIEGIYRLRCDSNECQNDKPSN